MIFKLVIIFFIISSVLPNFVPHQNFEIVRIRRSIPKKIDDNLKNHTKKTTNSLAESVPPTESNGLRAKRQDEDPNFTDYTVSTAFDEDNGNDIATVLTATKAQPKPPVPRPTVKQQMTTKKAPVPATVKVAPTTTRPGTTKLKPGVVATTTLPQPQLRFAGTTTFKPGSIHFPSASGK